MNCSRNWKIAMTVPWLAFWAMIIDIGRVYGQLPTVIASHFNAQGFPNGFAPKQQIFLTILVVSAGFLCVFTFLLSRFSQISGLGWLVMVAEYWGIGVLLGITHGTLRVALRETSVLDFPIGAWSLIMGGALVIGEIGRILAMARQSNTRGQLIAEETHNAGTMTAVFAGSGVVMIASPGMLNATGVARVIPIMIGFIMLLCAIWAFTGFRYRLTTSGLEIRMLGMPIRFIAAEDIERIQARTCNPLTDFGGWGIRGIGKMRAYIWGGNHCVHIHTHSGEDIYLGITDAERLARELAAMAPAAQPS